MTYEVFLKGYDESRNNVDPQDAFNIELIVKRPTGTTRWYEVTMAHSMPSGARELRALCSSIADELQAAYANGRSDMQLELRKLIGAKSDHR